MATTEVHPEKVTTESLRIQRDDIPEEWRERFNEDVQQMQTLEFQPPRADYARTLRNLGRLLMKRPLER